MKFVQLLAESGFHYWSHIEEKNHITLKGMVKNNGLFKSSKQKWFLEKEWEQWKKVGGGKDPTFKDGNDVKKLRGIKGVKKGEYIVEPSAYMKFGRKGRGQGTRMIQWGYVIDDVGVRESYRYGFKYIDGGETIKLDPSKTKLEWTRVENEIVNDARERIAQEEMDRNKKNKLKADELKRSQYIGDIGVRIKDVDVEVLRKNEFETQFGMSAITIMKDSNGNMIQHFGKNNLKVGDKKSITFTVKSHEVAEVNKWNKTPYKLTAVLRVK